MKNLIELWDTIIAPKTVLMLFALTACITYILRILPTEIFAGALMSILAYYYGSKQGEASANAAHALSAISAIAAANTTPTVSVTTNTTTEDSEK